MAAVKGKRFNNRVPVFLKLSPAPVAERAIEFSDEQNVKLTESSGSPQCFGPFKCVFPENTCQEQVFRVSTLPSVENLLNDDGNALLLVYGASGSGKTHTVSGGGKDVGLLLMTLSLLFDRLESSTELAKYTPQNFDDVKYDTKVTCDPEKPSFGIWISIVQVFNETLTDLLNESSHKPLHVTQDARGHCFVRDVTWRAVNSEEEALRLLRGARNRQTVASTKLNDSSSRSHLVVFLKVIRVVQSVVKVNQMVVVDLAGTERQAATGSSGAILRQASYINSSLLVLRRCIDAMRKGLQQIPFRDSKLTRVLSPFFTSMKTRFALIVCISCRRDRLGDSLNSIKFAMTASELLNPQEIINRFRETLRKSGQYQANKNPEEKTDTVQLPMALFNEMQADIQTAERLAAQNEELRNRIQILEESAENAKLMYVDKIASMRKEHRSAMKALREQDALRMSIQEELLEEMQEITNKTQKYKMQSRTLVALVRERLYPELELFRSRYGYTENFPPLTKEDTKAFEPPDDEVESCARCKSLEGSLDDMSRELQAENHLHERLQEQLRSERELRVLLQESNRLRIPSKGYTENLESSMELTCQNEPRLAADLRAEIEKSNAISGDSGNETTESREKSRGDEQSALERLHEEKQLLHENLVNHMRLLDQKDLVLEEAETRIRHLEEKNIELRDKFELVQKVSKQSEASRQQPSATTPRPILCDRCLRARRLQEIPRTAPPAGNGIAAARIRESALYFTPIFCGRRLQKKVLPRRRLTQTASSEGSETP